MRIAALSLALALASSTALAANSADQEIQHLLSFVEGSGCSFHRNGADHDSADAADHLRLKYRRGGRYADTAEHFIDRLASESSWTGKQYTVTCQGETEPSGEWLHRELKAYRDSASGD